MSSKTIRFRDGGVSGEVSLLGAMLGPAEFRLSNGKVVQPFCIAPWVDDPKNLIDTLPPILQTLRGEWPCVPFGVPIPRTDLPSEWLQGLDKAVSIEDDFIHGFSANHEWTDTSTSSRAVSLSIDYPLNHPVRKLTREISVSNDSELDFELSIETAGPVDLPIGLHPVFKLPKKPGSAKLVIGSFNQAHTFPVAVEPNISILAPDQQISQLEHVLRLDGSSIDLTSLPLVENTEELVLLDLSDGYVKLQNYDESYEVVLKWDIKQFPSCLLWISNYGRDYYPWNNRFLAIGIEPIASAFDLGVMHSRNPSSPLNKMGFKTSYSLQGFDRFAYQISVSSLEGSSE